MSKALLISTIVTLGFVVAPASAQLTGDDIARMQAEADANGWTFTVAENDVTHIPLEELCRAKVPPDWREKAIWDPCAPERDLPTYWNWREVDPLGCATAIRDQGNCGSCWVFGAIGTVECNIVRVAREFVDLSEQWFINCSDSGDCDGGWHTEAFSAMLCENGEYCDPCGGCGAVLEGDCPYVAQNRPCECPYEHPHCLEGWYAVGDDTWTTPSDEQIKQAVYMHGPVATTMAVTFPFQSYSSGVFNACTPGLTVDDINHVIVIMGWDDNAGSNGAWIVRNSWNTSWGEDGYGMIEYGCDMMGYATAYIVYPEPFEDCNSNGEPDPEDILNGVSTDCNSNTIPDECDLVPNPPVVSQEAYEEWGLALDFSDVGYPAYSMKQWDDFTVVMDVRLGMGEADFRPDAWACYDSVDFLVEIADVPGGAEAGGNVLLSTFGTGNAGLVTWDFDGAELAAGTYWISVQATGGFSPCGMVYWHRANRIIHNGSEHYSHNPLGGHGHGTDPSPGTEWFNDPADLAFAQHIVLDPDCNTNGVLDACDIAAGTSLDENGNGIPDECEGPDVCRGDSNCDGHVSWLDIDYFVAAMNDDVAAWTSLFAPGSPGCPFENNDADADGHVSWADIDPFVALMNTVCNE